MATPADTPVPLEVGPDFDAGPLTRYLRQAAPELGDDIRYFRFTGGNSNLTYLVKGDAKDYVLKREPPGAKAKGAHDMGREFRMMRSLAGVYPLAPKAVAFCEDPAVFGGAFVLMERIDGLIVRTAADGGAALPAQFLGLIDGLAALHNVDVAAAGLDGFGRPEGYRRRQTEGWITRFRSSATGEDPLGEHIAAWLLDHVPGERQLASVIHNDFKMDNLVWSEDAPERLTGVLDWEMSTLGDPLMDLACTLSFWMEDSDPDDLKALRAMPSAEPGIPTRQEALDRYLGQAKAELSNFRFYRCFGLFRRAVIEQQKFHRFSTGQTADPRFSNLDAAVRTLLEACSREVGL
ncbi:phosphotransferase family protein [Phenylobacterium sp.]|uniref:phosphotransferase family protein n=1 Tax=Phenylobacterium sp. TaxID=1871053 RepID=UPI002F429CF5